MSDSDYICQNLFFTEESGQRGKTHVNNLSQISITTVTMLTVGYTL